MTHIEFRAARKALGISQAKMGERLGGYKLRTVQSWEAGEREIPPAVRVLTDLLVKLQRP